MDNTSNQEWLEFVFTLAVLPFLLLFYQKFWLSMQIKAGLFDSAFYQHKDDKIHLLHRQGLLWHF